MRTEATGKRPETVPVTVMEASVRSVPVELPAIGTVQAYATVSVRSRVPGQITQVAFAKGQDLKKGDLLFTIDARPFAALVAQAKANLARDVVNQKNAELELARAQKLYKLNAVSEEEYQQFLTRVEALRATVEADQAAVEMAAVNLDYTEIRSPLDGRAGDLLVDEGNVVRADEASPLVVINQVVPIYVGFSVPEKYLPEIRRNQDQSPLEVTAIIPDDPAPLTGSVSLIDNIVDRATGTIRLKATFANTDRRLWPGLFVQVKLRLATLPDAIVVPAAAVQTGQQGSYVFVVDGQDSAQMRPVTTGVSVGGEVVVLQGLAAGDRVVTDGQLRLVPGARVSRHTGASPWAPPAEAKSPDSVDESSASGSPAELPAAPASAQAGGSKTP